MRRNLIGILSLLCSSFLFAVPASAVDLAACAVPTGFGVPLDFSCGLLPCNPVSASHFTFVAMDNIIFEGSDVPRLIDGNLLVTDSILGFVRVGKNITINGTVIAQEIQFQSSSSRVGNCVANVITGNAAAIAASGPGCSPASPHPQDFTAYKGTNSTCVDLPATAPAPGASFANLCGPTPVVAACANTAAPLTVAAGQTLTLTAGDCFGALRLNMGAVLNLTGPGEYTFRDVRMIGGSRLNGPAIVNVNRQFITEPGVFITDIDLRVPFTTGDVVAIFNNSIVSGGVINAPFGRCHPHTGTALVNCAEMCCKTLDIEPITADCPPGGVLCVCPPGFTFEFPLTSESDPLTARNCVPIVR